MDNREKPVKKTAHDFHMLLEVIPMSRGSRGTYRKKIIFLDSLNWGAVRR